MRQLTLAIAVVLFLACNALAMPSIDGFLSPGTEWDNYMIYGTDPNESLIDDNYDIGSVYALWDSTDVYIRTDVYGTPTLEKQNSGNFFNAFYQWAIDTSGDEIADLNLILDKAYDVGGVHRVALYKASDNSFLGWGTAGVNDIVEVKFAKSLVPTSLEPASDADVSMFLYLDNAGGDPDDRLPNTGWLHTVPEPGSAMLLGFGLLGIVGSVIRKKFKM